tara:strand:- start:181 stop:357 length:177 start_codon:yes stop_codon:yes gene_type:complete
MLEPDSGLKWSPWFKIIAKTLLPAWWDDLDTTLDEKNPLADHSAIHRCVIERDERIIK